LNWYILSQKWESFPRKQREFNFMHSPGYNRKATPYLDFEIPDDVGYDFNLYHVTTNLSGIINSGRLKSRLELGNQIGLGGGNTNEAPDLISVTFSYDKALNIYEDFKFVLDIVNGRYKASDVFKYLSSLYEDFEDDRLSYALHNWIGMPSIKRYMSGKITESEFLQIIDTNINTPEESYSFFVKLEEHKIESLLENFDDGFDSGSPVTGFTGTFEDMKKINPSELAILKLVAYKGAKADHVHNELELRFNPKDLRVVRVLKP